MQVVHTLLVHKLFKVCYIKALGTRIDFVAGYCKIFLFQSAETKCHVSHGAGAKCLVSHSDETKCHVSHGAETKCHVSHGAGNIIL